MDAGLLDKAIGIAVEAHRGQVDKAGRPYILHPLHLMLQMETEVEMITAVLHDVVEDSATTLDTLASANFPTEVLDALALLTHDDHTPYDTYIDQLSTNPIARRVKLADLEHNMDVRRLQHLGEKDIARLEKYQQAWHKLHQA